MRHLVRFPRSLPWSAALLGAVLLLPTSAGAKTITVPRCPWAHCYEDSTFAFNTVDSALTAANAGDRIYIRKGTYTAPSGGWKIAKTLEIFGDGPGGAV